MQGVDVCCLTGGSNYYFCVSQIDVNLNGGGYRVGALSRNFLGIAETSREMGTVLGLSPSKRLGRWAQCWGSLH